MMCSVNDIKRNNNKVFNDTFYCPVIGCKYNINFGQSSKSFKTQKLLKQVSSLLYIISNVNKISYWVVF